ncbi:hypothetical protein Sp245p_00355 [Azospirillum baldaniorum]|nr:hypothetical protein Sp245p_00355 [Azospirillum baldaniorum]
MSITLDTLAIFNPLPSGERVPAKRAVRGMCLAACPAKAQPHPNPLPAFGGPKVRLSRQRKRSLRVSGGERE